MYFSQKSQKKCYLPKGSSFTSAFCEKNDSFSLSHLQSLTHSFSITFDFRHQTFVSPHSQFTWPSPWHWDWSQIDTDWGRLTMSRCWVRCGITGNGGTLTISAGEVTPTPHCHLTRSGSEWGQCHGKLQRLMRGRISVKQYLEYFIRYVLQTILLISNTRPIVHP